MVDISAIAGALSALKGANDVAQAMIGLRDAAAFQTKLIEFQAKIIEANNSAFAAQEERSALLERISDLESEVTALKAWNAEKARYELKTVGYGAMAYMLKPAARGDEAPHWLCPNCFVRGQKSYLLRNGDKTGRDNIYACSGCKSTQPVTYPPKWIDGPSLEEANV